MPLIEWKNRVLALSSRGAMCAATACLAMLMGACVSSPPAPPPERPAALATAAAFDVAIDHAVDDLLVQVVRLPEFQPVQKSALEQMVQRKAEAPPRIKIAVDTTLDGGTGQQTAATVLLDQRLLARAVSRFPQFDVLAVSPDVLLASRFILVATLTSLDRAPQSGTFQISLSLTDMRSGLVVARAEARSTAAGIDSTPTPYFRDSPALTRDRAVDGQIKTAQIPVGAAADGVYLSNLTVAALIAEGARLYDAAQYETALRAYEAAVLRPDGKQARVFNGLYLANTQLGRAEAAEQAFSRIVSLGLATNNLSIKFLFRPGSTDFLSDPKVSAPYPMWLRVMAKEIAAGKYCLHIVGHSSRTGSESVNDRLSLQRAASLQKRLEMHVPDLGGRLQPQGMGFRENLIGIGTDDLRDALDRRVEFKVRSCQ